MGERPECCKQINTKTQLCIMCRCRDTCTHRYTQAFSFTNTDLTYESFWLYFQTLSLALPPSLNCWMSQMDAADSRSLNAASCLSLWALSNRFAKGEFNRQLKEKFVIVHHFREGGLDKPKQSLNKITECETGLIAFSALTERLSLNYLWSELKSLCSLSDSGFMGIVKLTRLFPELMFCG